jgi:hypothetical protein
VVMTSRNRLGGLVVANGAQALRLTLPSVQDARAMLGRRLSPAAVQLMLTELVRGHLLSRPAPNRYTSHELLRAYPGAPRPPGRSRAAHQTRRRV